MLDRRRFLGGAPAAAREIVATAGRMVVAVE